MAPPRECGLVVKAAAPRQASRLVAPQLPDWSLNSQSSGDAPGRITLGSPSVGEGSAASYAPFDLWPQEVAAIKRLAFAALENPPVVERAACQAPRSTALGLHFVGGSPSIRGEETVLRGLNFVIDSVSLRMGCPFLWCSMQVNTQTASDWHFDHVPGLSLLIVVGEFEGVSSSLCTIHLSSSGTRRCSTRPLLLTVPSPRLVLAVVLWLICIPDCLSANRGRQRSLQSWASVGHKRSGHPPGRLHGLWFRSTSSRIRMSSTSGVAVRRWA